MYIGAVNHVLLCSASSKVYPVLRDVLQRTEPTNKAGLGNNSYNQLIGIDSDASLLTYFYFLSIFFNC